MSDSTAPLNAQALEAYVGKIVVVKLGGNAMTDPELEQAFADDIAMMHAAGVLPIVMHGGGPQINQHLQLLGMQSAFIAGMRITTPEVMHVARMVLTGTIQRDIVNNINRHGPIAIGLSGEDAHLLVAEARKVMIDGIGVDVGLVGDVVDVNTNLLYSLLQQGFVPVVTGIGRGSDGTVYNVNADSAAAAVAIAMNAQRLVMLTDVPGLYADWPERKKLIATLTAVELEEMLPDISSGMAPKMEACLRAVDGKVGAAHVLDGRLPHAAVLSLTAPDFGTTVVP